MVREERAALASGQVRYLEAGAGWPVVLLHAFPLSADMWRPQLGCVPQGWRFIAPDLRGFGPEARGAAQSMDEMATGVLELLDALKIDQAALGGLSIGGYVAFAMMRREAERFNAVILADTRATADTEAGIAARQEMLDTLHARGVGAVADAMLPKLLGDTTRRSAPEIAQQVRQMIEASSVDGVAGGIQSMMGRPDSTALLDSICVPTLIIVG
ncbi:MAG TPA: alpha/beta hydrolase, partial [Vicinamibacterales bacterium]|nr:alpha/beta hydrolase [Vicinamibacterales bacterium]